MEVSCSSAVRRSGGGFRTGRACWWGRSALSVRAAAPSHHAINACGHPTGGGGGGRARARVRARERESEKTRERARAGERESERARERESERAAEEGQGGWVPVPGDRSDVGLCAVALVVREAVLRPFLAWSQQCSQGAARQSCCRTVGCTQRHRKPPGGSSLAIRTCCDDHAIPGHFRDDRCRCDREDLGVA